jgi:hypothetical protein
VAAKSESELALADKIDLARTLVRYKHRRKTLRELNDVEEAITKTHNTEVSAGSFTEIDLDGIGVGNLTQETKELTSGSATEKESD